jgi:hypothetical protein
MPEEDPERRRLRQLAETAGSLAPARIGAWTTPGKVVGESWSELPWLGRAALVIVIVTLAALFVLLVAVIARSGDVVAAAVIVAWGVVLAVAIAVGAARRRGAS